MTIPGLGQACFKVFYEAAHAEGALDARTKELLHIAVTLALHCEE